MDIKITVADKRCTVQGAPVIVCGNSGYTVTFTFDAEWDQAGKKTARFTYVRDGKRQRTDVELTGNTVNVPAVYRTMELQVGVYAGDLVTSTPARIPCEKSIVCDSCGPDDLFPGQVVQIERDLIDKTCPSFADIGEIVTCTPVKGHPMEVVSHLDTATGYDSITLSLAGKNFIPYPYYEKPNSNYGVSIVVQPDGSISFDGIPTRAFSYTLASPLVLPKGVYTFSYEGELSASVTFRVYSAPTTYAILYGNTKSATFTLENTTSLLVYIQIAATTNAVSGNIRPMIEVGASATAYEPYNNNSNTFTVDLGQTVYGGAYNWQTGVFINAGGDAVLVGKPQEILALSGTNVLSSSTGETEVRGKANPAAIIADLYDKINKLQAAAVNNA